MKSEDGIDSSGVLGRILLTVLALALPVFSQAPPRTPPSITTVSPLTAAQTGAAYSETLTASGSSQITWSVMSGVLPAGLTLNRSTGALSGTPTAAGLANFTVTATNAFGAGSKKLSLTVNAAPSIVTASPLTAALVGKAYSVTLAASGSSPISWRVASGALPAGLNLQASTGAIGGTPTASGVATFTVSASNAFGSGSRQLSLTVNAAPAIVTGSPLTAALVGTAYSVTLAANGSTPITWAVTGGALPAGLALNAATGMVSGTPKAAGVATFTVSASNALGSSSAQLSLTVNTPVTVLLTPSTVSLQPSQQQTFTATVAGTSNTGVTWSYSPALGSFASSAATAVYIAPGTAPSTQTVTVAAASVADPSVKATAVVTLPQTITVSVSPSTVSLPPSGTQKFTTTVLGTSNAAVTWSINPPVGTISSAGLYTAPASIATSQTVTVTAQSVATPKTSGNAAVGLSPPAVTYTYYVDSVNGLDSNPGTLAAPWKTIAKVNSTSLLPGQSVAFKAGGVWRETLTPGQSGTASQPITFTAYGDGAQPVISGANVTSWTQGSGTPVPTTVWYTAQTTNPYWPSFGGLPGIPESSLEAVIGANEWYWDGSSTLYAYATSDPSSTVEIPTRAYAVSGNGLSYLTFANLEMRGGAVHGFYCGSSLSCNSLTFTSDTFDLNYADGLDVLSNTGVADNAGTIQASVFKYNGASGIEVGGMGPFSNWLIDNNQVFSNCLYYTPADGLHEFTAGMYLDTWNTQTGGAGTVISNNVVHDNGILGYTASAGIWTDTTTGITITKNTVYNCSASGIFLEKTLNELVTYNTIYDCGQTMYTAGIAVFAGGGYDSIGNRIYNNSEVGANTWWGIAVQFEDASGTIANNAFANNLALRPSGTYTQTLYVDGVAANNGTRSSGNVYSNNGFGAAGGNFVNYGVLESTYAALDAVYGSAMNNMEADPLLNSPSSGDFTLRPGSPAVGAGIYIGGVSTANPPNIGAK
jgi:parallel beta-helix repeat protein